MSAGLAAVLSCASTSLRAVCDAEWPPARRAAVAEGMREAVAALRDAQRDALRDEQAGPLAAMMCAEFGSMGRAQAHVRKLTRSVLDDERMPRDTHLCAAPQ